MTSDEIIKWLFMTLPGIALGAWALILQRKREKNLPGVDDAVAEKAEAEARRIYAEMSRDQEREISDLRHDLRELSKRFDMATSYARMFYNGAVENADFIKRLDKIPPYVPPVEFPKIPTGPLGKLAT